jgi:hypothetical protein
MIYTITIETDNPDGVERVRAAASQVAASGIDIDNAGTCYDTTVEATSENAYLYGAEFDGAENNPEETER